MTFNQKQVQVRNINPRANACLVQSTSWTRPRLDPTGDLLLQMEQAAVSPPLKAAPQESALTLSPKSETPSGRAVSD